MTIPFSQPAVLLALVIPAWVLWRVWRRQSARQVLPFDHTRLGRGRLLALGVNSFESLPGLLMAVVILILAGPQLLDSPKTRRTITNIEFCIDMSGSMGAPFGDGTRYDAAVSAMNKFIDYRQGDAFGVTFFGNNVLHWTPLTTDVSAVKCAFSFMGPGKAPHWFGGTAIGKALLACGDMLSQRKEGDRMIILISDGDSADLDGDRPAEVARYLKERGIVVYTVFISESDVPAATTNLVQWTGGEVFDAEDPSMLDAMFKRIDQLKRTELERLAPETLDHFAPYCIAGLSMVGAAVLGLFGMRYTPW